MIVLEQYTNYISENSQSLTNRDRGGGLTPRNFQASTDFDGLGGTVPCERASLHAAAAALRAGHACARICSATASFESRGPGAGGKWKA